MCHLYAEFRNLTGILDWIQTMCAVVYVSTKKCVGEHVTLLDLQRYEDGKILSCPTHYGIHEETHTVSAYRHTKYNIDTHRDIYIQGPPDIVNLFGKSFWVHYWKSSLYPEDS